MMRDRILRQPVGGSGSTLFKYIAVGGNNELVFGTATVLGLNGYPNTIPSSVPSLDQDQRESYYNNDTALDDGLGIGKLLDGTYVFVASVVMDSEGEIRRDYSYSLPKEATFASRFTASVTIAGGSETESVYLLHVS